MLYNPKWNKTRKRSLADLVAWLEKQNPDKEYNYYDSFTCLAALYNVEFEHFYEIPQHYWPTFDIQLENIASSLQMYTLLLQARAARQKWQGNCIADYSTQLG